MITKVEFEKAMEMDRQQTIKELMENCDLLLKGNRMLTENRLSESEYMVLEEGLWEKVKYGLAKLGRYKAGGKIFGKGKIDQEAGAKIQAILDKKGNEVIKALDTKIKEENPEFPNNEKGEQFLKTVMEIAAVYDSIVASTKKKPNEKGFLPADAANSIIADLAEYVQKFLDVDLAAAYTVMDSEEEKVDNVNGDEELLKDEVEGINEDEAEDVRTQLQAKSGKKTYDTKRMGSEGLASNKLPLVLAGVGGALGALGWLAQTDFIKEIIIKIFGGDITVTDTEKITEILNGGEPDEKGFVHWAGKLMGKDLKTGADITEFVNKYGAEDVSHMFDGNGAGDSMTQVKQLQQLVGGENAGKSVGELFKSDTFGDMKQGRNLFGVSNSASFVSKTITTVVKKTVIKGAGTVIAAKVAAIGSVLAPIGIALIGTGAIVKLMRMKGLKQSRAKTLNDLLQSLQPVEAGEATVPPILPDPKPNPINPDKKGGKNICNAKNLDELNKMLDNTKALSQPLKDIGKFEKDPEFRKLFLDAFIGSTRQIKINKEPLLKSLQKLKENGLLEYGDPSGGNMSGSKRKYVKLTYQDLQKFLDSLMKLFAAVYKACKKTSKTFQLIKGFFKLLFKISSEGKGSINDNKKRDELWKRLTGSFANFLNDLNKLPKMEKGEVPKTEPKTPEEGRGGEKGTKGTFDGSAPRTKPPQLAHHDRGDKFLYEEISRIKQLMK